ncbi:MAG TPA: CYCXC family (seleno)protein [Pyrinomonadaceae bacterium]|jgi:hypothetical protein
MKSNTFRLGLLMLAALFTAACAGSESERRSASRSNASQQKASAATSQQQQQSSAVASNGKSEADAHAGHAHGAVEAASVNDVPAFETNAASLKKLPPTLSAGGFAGKQRLAYQVASEIPQTLAQLPCYCYCDRGFGHKSLHSCFVDDHAAHCAVCVDEALLAYRLQKEEKLSPEQIRERIIKDYAPKL